MNQVSRISLAQLPTPFYKLNNVSAAIGRNVFIKRDDMTGVSLGGNKVRKLEYLLAEAKEQGCDVVITTGGAQSNHAMLTAACCRMLGMEPILMLKKRGVMGRKGNLLLEALMDVDVRFVDTPSYDVVYEEMDKLAEELRAAGKKPYLIPVGGSVPLGTVGYVDCAKEIFEQAKAANVKIDRVICTAGSGGTLGGILLGTMLYGEGAKVTGIAVCDDPFEEITEELVNECAKILGVDVSITREDVDVRRYYGAGYAMPSKEGLAAIQLMAQKEGIMVDPVYTGKTFAGLLDMCEKGEIKEGENVVFLHSGGAASLFAIDPEDVVEA